LDNSGIIKKPRGPLVSVSRSEAQADCIWTALTAFKQQPPPPPCPRPWLRCHRFPAHRFPPPRRRRPPPLKEGTPPCGEPLSSSSAHCRHCAIIELPQNTTRSPSKLPITAPSSAPMPGATRTSLLVPTAAPLLHHRRSSPAELSHREQPAPTLLRPS
jgi:hypothetical protein